MTLVADYQTYSDARAHLKDVFDATTRGRTVTLRRDGDVVAVTPVDRLRDYFSRTVAPRISVARESDIVVAIMEGRPFAAEGATIDDAIDELIDVLREYAEDWETRLQQAPNHQAAWGLVQLVRLSSDDQLKAWMFSDGE